MHNKDFDYASVEVVCSDLKIVFITDEKTEIADQTNVHMHSFWELFYLQEGSLVVKSEQELYNLEKNQILIIPPNTYHNSEFSCDAVKKSVLFTFCKVKSSENEKLYDRMQAAFSGLGFHKLEDCGYIGMMLNMILVQDATESFAKQWRMRANVTELMFSLYDRIKNWDVIQPEKTEGQNTYWVYKYAIDRLMDIYYMNDISLEFLSEQLYLSPQNITRIISVAYGKSFNELKLELKMRNAKKLIRETALTVAEIGEKIGYTTTRGFLSAFLKYEGCTPSEYRREYKKDIKMYDKFTEEMK